MWGCDLVPSDADVDEAWEPQAGYDVDGRPRAWRGPAHGKPAAVEVAESIDGDRVVRTAGGHVVRTACDANGRPVMTTYDGGRPAIEPERYEYDGDGRLRVIHESDGLWLTCEGSERLYPGGRLEVEHDGAGPLRVVGEPGLVWERPVTPWPDRLAEGAGQLADACLAWTRAACRQHDVPPGT